MTFHRSLVPAWTPQSAAPIGRDGLPTETADYAQFKSHIYFRTGIDLNLYKQPQMHRRLMAMVERAGCGNFEEYSRLLETNSQEFTLFLDRLTINVSELFRNPEKWDELRTVILPPLLEQNGALKVWSAGCSYGAEPYSLAILLDQLAPGAAHTVHATDLDKTILLKAREGKFSRADIRSVPSAVQSRYFVPLPEARPSELPDFLPAFEVKPEIRRRVTFHAHNLLADNFERNYDLICCRNVVIYFTDDAKEKLYARFRDALKIGGVLFVGGTERIFNARELGLSSTAPFFYQRIA